LIVVALSFLSLPITNDLKRADEIKTFTTPTQTRFVCSPELAVSISDDGSVTMLTVTMSKYGMSKGYTPVATIDQSTNTIVWNPHILDTKQRDTILPVLKTCKNIDSKSALEVYPGSTL